ncbi:hypothetical protein OFC63_33950, partial [Escherichia coli]|nr:hypothetical protein [Escherichia coli]
LELRNQSDRFLDLRELQGSLERTGGGRRIYPNLSESTAPQEGPEEASPASRLMTNLEEEV